MHCEPVHAALLLWTATKRMHTDLVDLIACWASAQGNQNFKVLLTDAQVHAGKLALSG